MGRIPLVVLLVTGTVGLIGPAARAAPALTIQPITWNVVGLDSNNVFSGPNRFMVGARVCNTGTDPATNVVATFNWDSANSFINVDGASTLSTETLSPGACFDFYFDIAITRTRSAYDTSRDYHISATADGLGSVSTPIGREIYVERLVSQNRNSVQAITGPGGLGDPPATTVFVGETYTYKLYSSTAPAGYEQLESFINFSNVIFQVLSVSTTYTAPPGGTNDKIYADACGWDNDPSSPTYRSCIGPPNYPGGKAGGDIVTTYTVKILSPGTTVITALIYDFSGSSYHYNSDYGGFPLNALVVEAVRPADLSLTKSHAGDFTVGQQGTYQLSVTNDGGVSASGPITITDTLPAGLSFVSGTGTGWACSALGQDVTCTRATSLGAGASSSVSLVVDVAPAAAPQVTNSATVSFNGTDQTPANNTATDLTNVVPSADLSVTKTHTGEMVVGLPFTFDILVSNAGPSDSAGPITVTDTLPAGLTYLSFSGAGWSCSASGQDVTCSHAADLGAGQSSSFALIVDVGAAAFPSVTNSATVVPTTSDPDSSNNSDTDVVTAAGAADLALTKTHTGNFVAGEQGTYDLIVANEGTGAARGPVVLSDTLPGDLSFVSGSGAGWSCSAVGQDVTCTHATGLAAGATTSVSLTVDVDSNASASVTNTATVSSDSADAEPSDNTDQDPTTIDRLADLSIAKSHAGSFLVGAEGTYDISVSNAGPSDAKGQVTVSDTLPTGLSYQSASGAGWSCSAVGQDVTCTHAADLAAGANTALSLTVDVGPAAAPSVTNVASVDSATADPNDTNNSDQDPTAVNQSADLSVTKTASTEPFFIGAIRTYTLSVSNAGPSPATGVQVVDALPSELSFVSATPSQGSCAELAGVVTCSVGTIAVGDNATIALVVSPTAAGPVDNTAEVLSDVGDPNSSNNQDTESVIVQDPPPPIQADLSIAKSHSTTFVVGTQGTYDLTVSNAGPTDAQGPITVLDTLPVGLAYDSFSGAGWSCSAVGQDVTCTHAGDLPSGNSSSFTLTVDVGPAAAPSVTNVASVDSATADPDDTNNADQDRTGVVDVDLSIAKSHSANFVAGEQGVYDIIVSNLGTGDAAGPIVVNDTLPAGLSFVSVSGAGWSCSAVGQDVTCSHAADLAAGTSSSFSVVVDVARDAPGSVTNTAAVSSGSPDPNPANDSDGDPTTIDREADLSLSKSHDASFVVGTVGTYDLEVSNDGPSDAEGPVTVSDTLPAGLSYRSFFGAGWSCSATGQDVTCSHPADLPAGTSATVSLMVDVGAAAAPAVTNAASVASASADPNDGNNTDQDPTAVDPSADLSLTKTASADPVEVDASLTYTLTVSNAGPSAATNVQVGDVLPGALSFVSADPSQGNCGEIAGVVVCSLGSIPAGGSATIALEVSPTAAGEVSNTAEVLSEVQDPDPSNNEDTESVTVEAVPDAPEADLILAKAHSGDLTPGERATYVIEVSNAGPDVAAGPIVVTDELPAELSYVSSSGDGWSCVHYRSVVTCQHVGDIAVDDASSLNLVVGVDASVTGQVENAAWVVSRTADPNASNNEDNDLAALSEPDPGRPSDDPSASPTGGSSRRLAFTGFEFDRLGSIALVFLAVGGLLILVAAVLRRSSLRHAAATTSETLTDAWSSSPSARRRSGGTARRASRLGLVSLIAGLLVFGHLGWMLWGSGLGTARAQAQLRNEFSVAKEANRQGTGRSIPAGSPIGVIRIPRLDVDMVVVEGTGDEQLRKGPGHYRDTAMPWDPSGRVGIAGHRTTYLRPFFALDKLQRGDVIVLQTKRGTFRYEVRSVREVQPDDVSVLRQTSRPSLALTTCSPVFSAEKRLVVIADRTSG